MSDVDRAPDASDHDLSPHWRAMAPGDLGAVLAIADARFPDHPEDGERFAERLRLAPAFCSVLETGPAKVAGYLVAYPWPIFQVPPLNRPLGAVGGEALFIHDIALDVGLEGRGLAPSALARLVAAADVAGIRTLALVAVNGTARYWERQGFSIHVAEGPLAAKLATYGESARYMIRPLE